MVSVNYSNLLPQNAEFEIRDFPGHEETTSFGLQRNIVELRDLVAKKDSVNSAVDGQIKAAWILAAVAVAYMVLVFCFPPLMKLKEVGQGLGLLITSFTGCVVFGTSTLLQNIRHQEETGESASELRQILVGISSPISTLLAPMVLMWNRDESIRMREEVLNRRIDTLKGQIAADIALLQAIAAKESDIQARYVASRAVPSNPQATINWQKEMLSAANAVLQLEKIQGFLTNAVSPA